MRDDQWQQAFNAGRAEAEGLVEALERLSEYPKPPIASQDWQNGFMTAREWSSSLARTALAKYREGL